MSDELLYLSATELLDAYRSKRVSPVEVIDTVLARIQELQPTVNAFVTVCHDDARKTAQDAEAALSSGEGEGAIAGIPYSVKDLVPTKGVRTTFGSAVFGDNVPKPRLRGGRTIDGRGRNSSRQDDDPRPRPQGRHDQPGLRSLPQPLEPRTHLRRVERRCRGRRGQRTGAPGARHGRRRVGPDSRERLRHRGPKANPGPRPAGVGAGPFRDLELYRPDDSNRRGRGTDCFP